MAALRHHDGLPVAAFALPYLAPLRPAVALAKPPADHRPPRCIPRRRVPAIVLKRETPIFWRGTPIPQAVVNILTRRGPGLWPPRPRGEPQPQGIRVDLEGEMRSLLSGRADSAARANVDMLVNTNLSTSKEFSGAALHRAAHTNLASCLPLPTRPSSRALKLRQGQLERTVQLQICRSPASCLAAAFVRSPGFASGLATPVACALGKPSIRTWEARYAPCLGKPEARYAPLGSPLCALGKPAVRPWEARCAPLGSPLCALAPAALILSSPCLTYHLRADCPQPRCARATRTTG